MELISKASYTEATARAQEVMSETNRIFAEADLLPSYELHKLMDEAGAYLEAITDDLQGPAFLIHGLMTGKAQ